MHNIERNERKICLKVSEKVQIFLTSETLIVTDVSYHNFFEKKMNRMAK